MVAQAHLRRERLDATVADRLVAARVTLEVCDARNLEPDDERRVMGDALCVGLCEADADVVENEKPSMRRNPKIPPCPPLRLPR